MQTFSHNEALIRGLFVELNLLVVINNHSTNTSVRDILSRMCPNNVLPVISRLSQITNNLELPWLLYLILPLKKYCFYLIFLFNTFLIYR